METLGTLLAKLESGKTKARQDAIKVLDQTWSHHFRDVGLQHIEIRKLVPAVLKCNRDERHDYEAKAAKLGLTGSQTASKLATDATRLTKSASLLRSMVESIVDWCVQASHLRNHPHMDVLQDVAKALNRLVTHQVVEHVVPMLEWMGELFRPVASAYTRILELIATTPVLRHNLVGSHVDLIVGLCIRHLAPPPTEDGHSPTVSYRKTAAGKIIPKSQVTATPQEISLAKVFSRMLLCLRRPLVDEWPRLADFLFRFFASSPNESTAHSVLVSSINFLLLRVLNSIPHDVHPFLVKASEVLAPFWDTKTAAMRRELITFFNIVYWAVFGGSLVTDDIADALREVRLCFDTLWTKTVLELEKSTLAPWCLLSRNDVTLEWLQPTATAATSDHAHLPLSPLVPACLRLKETATMANQRRALMAWDSLLAVAETTVRLRQLETLPRAELPIDAPDGAPNKRPRRMNFVESFHDVCHSGKRPNQISKPFFAQVIAFTTMRYPTTWTPVERASALAALTEMLQSDVPDVYFWACVALAALVASVRHLARADVEAEVHHWTTINNLLLRRNFGDLTEPTYFLLTYLFVHRADLACDVAVFEPAQVFGGDHVVLGAWPFRFTHAVVQASQFAWSTMEWTADALKWLFADPGRVVSAATDDPRAVVAFFELVSGGFARAQQTAHRTWWPMALPAEDFIVEHEFRRFVRVSQCLFEGSFEHLSDDDKLREPPSGRANFLLAAAFDQVVVGLVETCKTVATNAPTSDAPTQLAVLHVVLRVLQYGLDMSLVDRNALEQNTLFVAANALLIRWVERFEAVSNETAIADAQTVQTLVELARVLGLCGLRDKVDAFAELRRDLAHIHPCPLIFESTVMMSVLETRLVKKLEAMMVAASQHIWTVTKTSRNSSPAGGSDDDDDDFASSTPTTKSLNSLMLDAHYSTYLPELEVPYFVLHAVSMVATLLLHQDLVHGGEAADPDEADAISARLVGHLGCLIGPPAPILASLVRLIEARPSLLRRDGALTLFDAVYDTLELAQNDPSVCAPCTDMFTMITTVLTADEGTGYPEDLLGDFELLVEFTAKRPLRNFSHPDLMASTLHLFSVVLRERATLRTIKLARIHDVLASLFNDGNCAVCLDTIQSLGALVALAHTPTELKDLFAKTRPRDHVDGERADRPLVRLMYYTQLAITCEYLRTDALVEVYQLLHGDCTELAESIVEAIVHAVSKGSDAFVEDNLVAVLVKWAALGRPVLGDAFPYALIARTATLEQYYQLHCSKILIALLFNDQYDGVELLASAVQRDVKVLLSEHFASIFAAALPRYYDPDQSAQTADHKGMRISEYLEATLGHDVFTRLYTDSLDQLLVRMILSIQDSKHDPAALFPADAPSQTEYIAEVHDLYAEMALPEDHVCFFSRIFPGYSAVTVLLTLADLARQRSSTVDGMISVDMFMRMVRALQSSLTTSAKQKHEQLHWLHVYRVLFVVAPGNTQTPFFVRFIVTHLLNLLNETVVPHHVAQLIRFMLRNDALEALGYSQTPYLLTTVLPTLCDFLLKCNDKPVNDLVYSLIVQVLEFHKGITQLDPKSFPPFRSDPVFQQLAEWRTWLFATKLRVTETADTLVHYLTTSTGDHEVIKSQLMAMIENNQVTPEQARKLAAVLLSSPKLEATDVELLGKLYPHLVMSAALRDEAAEIELDPAQGALKVIGRYIVAKLGDPRSIESLDECARLMRHLPKKELCQYLSPEETLLFSILPPDTAPSVATTMQRKKMASSSMPWDQLRDQALWTSAGKSFQDWMTGLVPVLVSAQNLTFFVRLQPLMLRDARVAEQLFPHLCASLLLTTKKHKAVLSAALAGVFKNHEAELAAVLRLSLKVVAHLNAFSRPDEKLTDLELNYLDAAYAAKKCQLLYDAILFAERYHRSLDSDSTALLEVEALLAELHQLIGEPDGFYAVAQGTSDANVLATFEHEKNWLKVLGLCEANLDGLVPATNPSFQRCIEAMEMMGFDRLLLNMRLGGSSWTSLKDEQYQSLWRNQQWDVQATPEKALEFHGHVFELSRALHHDNSVALAHWRRSGLELVGKRIQSTTRDVPLFLATVANQASALEAHVMAQFPATLPADPSKLLSPADQSNELLELEDKLDFDRIHSLLTIRFTLLTVTKAPPKRILDSLLHHVHVAKQHHGAHVAKSLLRAARNLPLLAVDERLVAEQDAKLYWRQGDHALALRMVHELIDAERTAQVSAIHDGNANGPAARLARLLNRAGQWLAENRSQAPDVILEKYFDAAIQLDPTNAKIAWTLARYAHDQYEAAEQSETMALLVAQRDVKMRDIDALKAALKGVSKSSSNYQRIKNMIAKVEPQLAMDTEEITRHEQLQLQLVVKAVTFYLQALRLSDKYDQSAYAVCSLWLSNCDSADVNQVFAHHAGTVPPRKFLCMTNQLTARLGFTRPEAAVSHEERMFQATLTRLIELMVLAHPHHTLYQMFALSNGNVQGYTAQGYRRVAVSDEYAESRLTAVNKLLAHIVQEQANQPAQSALFGQYQSLVEAYIQLAYAAKPARAAADVSKVAFDRTTKLRSVQDFTHVPVTTIVIPYDADPTTFPTIRKFKPEYGLVGGVNAPKLVEIHGSDGKYYKALVKGNDDLRQDGTLMHVFGVVDQLLKKHGATRQRNLTIRTYKVVPLAPRAGLLEWCEKTCPVGTILAQLYQQHKRPNDLTPTECRELLHREHARAKATRKSKAEVLTKVILPRLPPVFHKWFELKPSAEEWFHARLQFARSCAATSIMGYVVGLGDRHSQNILLDTETAQIVHIDLGIAFDSGRVLPIPETIPFRLTQNILDGLGVKGVEGVFRRCCEETLRVLRQESRVIMTILEVLKFDPLYSWTIDPQKLLRVQRARAGGQSATPEQEGDDASPSNRPASAATPSSNKEAERALLGVRRKLDDRVSVECMVNDLIQTATNPENLASLFSGWQAYL
ncbi:hypothetical protein GGF31_003749 [Allomyces arbusculus]|nr:hypothetical protein GGF31_003749 [Allomyces arbusculus]